MNRREFRLTGAARARYTLTDTEHAPVQGRIEDTLCARPRSSAPRVERPWSLLRGTLRLGSAKRTSCGDSRDMQLLSCHKGQLHTDTVAAWDGTDAKTKS